MKLVRKLLRFVAKILCAWLIILLLLSIVYQGKRHIDVTEETFQIEWQQGRDENNEQAEVSEEWMK